MSKFPHGRVVATPGAMEIVTSDELDEMLARHVSGDYGQVPPEDAAANDQAILDGTRIMSTYRTASGREVWVITEADRSVTTLLLPEEY